MKIPAFIVIVCLMLAGCALEEKGQWVRPDTTEAQWKKDNYECTRDATYYEAWGPYPGYYFRHHHYRPGPYLSVAPRLNPQLYAMCLQSRGYVWRPERPL